MNNLDVYAIDSSAVAIKRIQNKMNEKGYQQLMQNALMLNKAYLLKIMILMSFIRTCFTI
jgi:hypothetical protein